MKVALIQLPLQSHDYVYSLENIPLAAGYLVSYASAMSAPADFIVCPSDIVNLGGDAAILRWLEEVRPDMVGFGCYVWNIHRTLYLCSLVRQRLERCLIVLGGPEVTPDNDFLLSHESFHFSIVGEGEETFTDLIRSVADGREDMHEIQGLMVRSGRNMLPAGRRGTIRDLGRIPSPYLTGIVGPSLNRNMLMETVRGCPMQCTYCYYHKSSPSVRTFAIDRVRDELSWAISEGLGEVTLIDPCFTRRKDLSSLLEAFASERSETLRFSCELNAEDLDPKIVDALLKAGLAHVEIGLQSTNEKALRNVGRRFDREAFIRGVKMLRSSGVKVMTDIMVGLPGDTLDNVKNSVDFVLAGDLCDELSLYPLSILPGTVLR
ncbi:MAG TPA: radical SAM protein, partial [Desulfomonilia bacterium]|nr:radical SAM protein [Desulfomonilia bacterium]